MTDPPVISFHRIGPLGRFDLVVEMSVCLFVPFHVVYFEAYFPPTSQNWMSNPWGKVPERNGLRIEHFCWDVVLNRRAKKK